MLIVRVRQAQRKCGVKFEKGQGMLDLLIGIALSLVLALALIQLFSITNSSVKVTSAISNLIDNANIAVISIRNVAVNAGKKSPYIANYRGCYNSAGGSSPFQSMGGIGWNVNQIYSCVSGIYSLYTTNGGSISTDFGMLGTGSTYNCLSGSGYGYTYRYGYAPDGYCENFNGGHVAVYELVGNDFAYLAILGFTNLGPFSGTSGYNGSSFTGTSPTSASLNINFQGQTVASNPPLTLDNPVDCTGKPINHGQMSFNTFYLDSSHNLNCTASIYHTLSCTGGGWTIPYPCTYFESSNSVTPLVPNVYVMEVLYATGLYQPMGQWKTTGGPTGYVDPSNFTSNTYIGQSYWNFMQFHNLGIQLGLLLQSNDNVTPFKDTKTYSLVAGTQYKNFNDNRLRRAVTITLKTNECVPENDPQCDGAPFVAWANGNQTGGKIHQGEIIVVRTENNSATCPNAPYLAEYACYMDAQGNFYAAFGCNRNYGHYSWDIDGGWGTSIGFYPFNAGSGTFVNFNNVNPVIRCKLGSN